jgi:hypothetical protein
MAASNLIFTPTVGEMNADNTVFQFAKTFDIATNAVVTGNTYKFKSDRERMQALLGSRGNTRNSGYFDGLFLRFYPITVLDPTLPSQTLGQGWGSEVGTPGPITNINFDDTFLGEKTGSRTYIGCSINGYIFSPVSTTAQVRTRSDDGSVVFVNNTLVLNNWAYQGATTVTSSDFILHSGYNAITINYFNGAGPGSLEFTLNIGNTGFTSELSCICFHNYKQL